MEALAFINFRLEKETIEKIVKVKLKVFGEEKVFMKPSLYQQKMGQLEISKSEELKETTFNYTRGHIRPGFFRFK